MKTLLLSAALILSAPAAVFAQDTVLIEVPQPVQQYVIANPVDPVVIQQDVAVGTMVPEPIILTPIPDNPDYSYFYVDSQPVIVSTQDRKIIYLAQ